MKKLPLRQPPMQAEPLARFDWAVMALDGSPFPMDRMRGETMVLNICSTKCGPCVAELPSIERLHKAVGSDGVKVLCVATDPDVNTVREFVAAKGFQLPVYALGDSEIPQVFDSDYIPATYVVNADGHIVYQHTGAALWDHPRVIALLRGLVLQNAVVPLKDHAVA